ncbi:MAG: hypothetical protein Q7T44_03260 [Parvibaculum sp.]|nr:hypothetical protein [Parvibaculum sp.]
MGGDPALGTLATDKGSDPLQRKRELSEQKYDKCAAGHPVLLSLIAVPVSGAGGHIITLLNWNILGVHWFHL